MAKKRTSYRQTPEELAASKAAAAARRDAVKRIDAALDSRDRFALSQARARLRNARGPTAAQSAQRIVQELEAKAQAAMQQDAAQAMQEASGHTAPTELDRAMEANRSTRRNAPTPEDEMRLERRAASSSGAQPGIPIQDQRKAAEKRADASGPTIRPTAASSGKQAADPSIVGASQTTSQEKVHGMVENPPGSGRLTPPTRKQLAGRGPAVPKTPRKLSMDPKQVARRAKRGFPSGH